MIINFVHDDQDHELVATGSTPLGFDGPISAVYQPDSHSYYATIERRLSPQGKLAVDIACMELDGQVMVRVTEDGAIVFSPSSADATQQQLTYGRLCGNFTRSAPVLEFKAKCIFGEEAETPSLSFVGSAFQQHISSN